MPGREPHHIRRLVTVIATVAAAGTITGLSVPSAMAAQPTAPAPRAAVSTRAAGSQEDQLNGVACRSANDCVAVGADYLTHTPLAETWNGAQWRVVSVKLPSGASGAYLNGVACPAAAGTYCVAAGVMIKGSTGEALSETWNGKAWTPVLPSAPAGSQLEAISCLSAKSCVAVGAAGASHGIGALLTESWNGTKWTRGSISAPPHTQGGFLDGVSCATASFCVATGAVFVGSAGAEAPLIEGWNGKAWAIMKLAPPKTSIPTGLYAVSCPSADSCLTVGSGGNVESGSIAYAEAWNGKTWALTSAVPWPKGTTDPWLYGVSCSAVGHCVAGGLVDWDPASNGTVTGRAAAATWNGKTWTPTTVTVPGKDNASAFAWVTCLPGKTAFCAAVGDVGPWGTYPISTLSGFWNGKTWKVVLPAQ
jgi:hypothetical protein